MKRKKIGALVLLVVGMMFLFVPQEGRAQQVLTLEECRALAINGNHELKIEAYNYSKAKAKRGEVASHFLPQVTLGGALMKVDKPVQLVDWDYLLGSWSRLVPRKVESLTSLHFDDVRVVGGMALQPVFMGGKIYHGTRMADGAMKLAQTMAQTKQAEVIESVDEVYWQVVMLSSKKKLLENLTELLAEARRSVDLAIQSGISTHADGLEVRTKQSEAELKLNEVEHGLRLSRMLLAQRCGLGVDQEIEPADALFVDSLGMASYSPSIIHDESEVEGALSKRSEVRSLNIAIGIMSDNIGVQRADMLPKVALLGGYTATSPNPFTAPRQDLNGSWMIGVGVSVPITGILTGAYKVKGARAEREIKKIELASAQEKIRLQMRQNILAHKDALFQLESARNALTHADENLRYARIGYDEEVIPLLNLLGAQTSWAKAHDAYIEAFVALKKIESKAQQIFPQ